MKKSTLLLFLLICLQSFSQSVPGEECGKDSLIILNDCESKYLNENCAKPEQFDFTGKSVIFRDGNYGHFPATKEHYFTSAFQWSKSANGLHQSLIILNEEEKKMIGTDAIVTTWSKIPVTAKNRKRFVKNASGK